MHSGRFDSNPTERNHGTFAAGIGVATFALMLTCFCPTRVQAQGALANGANYYGTIIANSSDTWTLSANPGDYIYLRLGTTNFQGYLQLFAPNGTRVSYAYGGNDNTIEYTAATNGTFTVSVSSLVAGGSGNYVLRLAQVPEPFSVPGGDEGGALTNGAHHYGTIPLADVDMWNLTANKGDYIYLRLGSTNFQGYLELFGPTGTRVAYAYGGNDNSVEYTAATNGTYTALVSSLVAGGTGTYVLDLAQPPEAFVVPVGDQGGTLTNGSNNYGTLSLADLDVWSFTAKKGDSIYLRLGSTNFQGYLELFGPNGTRVSYSYGGNDNSIEYTAATNGTYTAVVSSLAAGDTGSYVLYLAQPPEPFVVPVGDEGGALINGANHYGTISLADVDIWNFTANKGDTIYLRLGTTNFQGYLELYGTDGTRVAYSYGGVDNKVEYIALTNGTFTVLASSLAAGGTGTYVLRLAEAPEPFVAPVGDEGGTLTNGANNPGIITLGDIDMWSFAANKNDVIYLRLGTTNFQGWIELFGPNGALISQSYGGVDNDLAYTATTNGTFTVFVSSEAAGGTGAYLLDLAKVPGSFVVSPGDQGGGLNGGTNYFGTIDVGDVDMYAFTACKGDVIRLHLNTTNFTGYMNLYGPTGAVLGTIAGTNSSIAYTATVCGTFVVLIDSYIAAQSGTYNFMANGLSYVMKICPPILTRTNLTVNGVGGNSGATFVLYSTTNIATPLNSWTPVWTNQFDQYGVFAFTNSYPPGRSQQFYRFLVP
jgi:hypothetical protein